MFPNIIMVFNHFEFIQTFCEISESGLSTIWEAEMDHFRSNFEMLTPLSDNKIVHFDANLIRIHYLIYRVKQKN